MSEPAWAAALQDGARVTSDAGELTIEHREIGSLRLPSGRVVAADAIVEAALPPFARRVVPGRYPVRLAIAHIGAARDQRVALAWVAFAQAPVARWEPARLEGRPASEDPAEGSAYGVDSGTGSFLSPEAAAPFTALVLNGFDERVSAPMEATYADTRNWAVVEVGEGLDVALFSSGYGDGAYASYWGLDEAGAPVLLVTDFGLLDPPRGASREGRRPWWKLW